MYVCVYSVPYICLLPIDLPYLGLIDGSTILANAMAQTEHLFIRSFTHSLILKGSSLSDV